MSHALADMQALRMIHRDGHPWRTTATTSLTELALRMGAIEEVEAQITRYRHERRLWHAHLARFAREMITELDIGH